MSANPASVAVMEQPTTTSLPASRTAHHRPIATQVEPPVTRRSVTPQFARFGEWGDEVAVVRDGAIGEVARQMATHAKRLSLSSNGLWGECQQALPFSFRTYQVVRLDAPSFFLPAGEVVFTVTKDPMQLPDNPPQGVMMRHLEAMNAHPLARFYLLEPVFVSQPSFRLYSADDLREEANGDRQEAEQVAKLFGWAFRCSAWVRNRTHDAAAIAVRFSAWVVEVLSKKLKRLGPRRLSQHDLERLLQGEHDADDLLERWVRDSRPSSLEDDRRRLRRAIDELRWRASIDPVLCFELPDRPGELWFESHWFTGADGKRYVHY